MSEPFLQIVAPRIWWLHERLEEPDRGRYLGTGIRIKERKSWVGEKGGRKPFCSVVFSEVELSDNVAGQRNSVSTRGCREYVG